MKFDIKTISEDYGNKHILVVGDIILDAYVYGNVDPESMVDDLCELASKYADSESGIVAWRERPDSLRRNVIARIPPLD